MVLYLRFRAQEHYRGELFEFLRKAVPYYEQPGGIRVRLFQSLSAPDVFLEVVEYKDRETYELDQQRVGRDSKMKALLEEWHSLHAGPVTAEAYYELNPSSSTGGDNA